MPNEPKEELVKVIIDVRDETFGVNGERVCAKPLGDDLYEIRNTPWHTCDIGWGDVVKAMAEAENQWPKFQEIVRPSGHRTLHIFFFSEASANEKTIVLNCLKDWKATYENNNNTLYAIDIDPTCDFDGLCRYLDERENAGILSYRTVVSAAKPN
jgi:hypothetical protein